MGDVCAGRTSMFQDLVRLLAIRKKSDQKNPVDRHDIFIIEEGHKMKKMIGYCGLDCEKCDAYLATINDDQALREKTAKLWAELNQAPILPEHRHCQGCRVDGVKTIFCDKLCAIRQCALKKGMATCGNCADLESCSTVRAILENDPSALANLKG